MPNPEFSSEPVSAVDQIETLSTVNELLLMSAVKGLEKHLANSAKRVEELKVENIQLHATINGLRLPKCDWDFGLEQSELNLARSARQLAESEAFDARHKLRRAEEQLATLTAQVAELEVENKKLKHALAGHLFDGESLGTRGAIRNELIEQGIQATARLAAYESAIAGAVVDGATEGEWVVNAFAHVPPSIIQDKELRNRTDAPVVNWMGFDDSCRTKEVHEANARQIVAAVNTLRKLAAMAGGGK